MESIKQRRERLEAEASAQKRHNVIVNKLKRRIRSDINASGYLSVTYKLEYIRDSPIEFEGLAHNEIIRAYNEVLEKHVKK